MSIEGKVVLVTGAAQGIGQGIATRLAQDGADIALLDLEEDALHDTQTAVEAEGRRTLTIGADVTDRSALAAAVDRIVDELGGFDILINNAGIAQVNSIEDTTGDEFDSIFSVNVKGVLNGIQVAAAKFKERDQGGKIINATSIAAHEAYPMLGLYSATKHAVRALTSAAAQEFASAGITVNGYSPGIVGTGMWEEIDRRFSELTGADIGATYEQYAGGIALGRPSTPEDVAKFVSFLAGPDSDYMTGQTPLIDGGLVYR